MRIGVDIDGVLFDFYESWRLYAQSKGVDCRGVQLVDGEPAHWRFYEDIGLTEDEFLHLYDQGVNDGEILLNAGPRDGAAKAMQDLITSGHEVHLVTDRFRGDPGKSQALTQSWLAFWQIPYDTLTISADKTSVELDVFIEDRIENAVELVQAGTPVYLVNRPWNWLPDIWANITRVHSVGEAVAAILAVDDEPPLTTEPERRWSQGTPAETSTEREAFAALAAIAGGDIHVTTSGEVRVTSSTGAQKGTKLERFDLIPSEALRKVARHYGLGAEKYAPWNWRRGYDWSLSLAALERHLNAFKAGEDTDEETQSPHLAAVVFHALALLTFADEHPEFDDRWSAVRDAS